MCFVVRPRKHCPFFIVRVIWKENLQRKMLWKILAGRFFWGVTFHSLLVTRWNSLFARCSLQKSLVTSCKIRSLPVAEVARCKKSLVTRCKIRSLLVAEVARCRNSLVTRCKIRSLLVAEVCRCKNSLATRCKLCLIPGNKSLVT